MVLRVFQNIKMGVKVRQYFQPGPGRGEIASGPSKLGYYGIVVLLLSILGRSFGLFREMVFSAYFGTSGEFDAFTIVFSSIFFVTTSLNVIPFIMIPTMVKTWGRRNEEEFSTQLTSILFLILFLVGIFLLIGEIWAEGIVSLVALGLTDKSDLFRFAVVLMRISLPIILLMAFAQLFRSLLNIDDQFAVPSLEQLFTNVAAILAVILGWRYLTIRSPLTIPLGYYFAYLFFLALCTYRVMRVIRFSLIFDLVTIKRIMMGISVLLLATFINYLNPLILFWHASFLSEGSISAFGYVRRLMIMPTAIFVNAFLVVFLTFAARQFTEGRLEELKEETERVMVKFLVFSIYTVAFIAVNGEAIVQLIYQRGAFGAESVRIVSGLLFYYVPWVFFFPLSSVVVRIYYVQKDYRTLVIISLIGLLLTLALAPLLRRTLGLNGIGLMSSLHMGVYSLALMFLMHKKHLKVRYHLVSRYVIPQLGIVLLIVGLLFSVKQFLHLNSTLVLMLTLLLLGVPFLWWFNNVLDLVGMVRNRNWRSL